MATATVSGVVIAGISPIGWAAPAAGTASTGETPVAEGAADPTLQNQPLGSARALQAGASVASTSGATLASLPSRVLPTGQARMVGLTWPGAAPQVVELRSQNPDGSWTDWVQVDPAEDDNGDSRGSDPVWIGDSKNVEVRAARDGRDAATDLTAVLIQTPVTTSEAQLDNPGAVLDGAPDVVLESGGASVASAMPKVTRRAQWGANESYRKTGSTYNTAVRAATIHHTASTNSYTKAQAAAQMRGFYTYHTKTLGWNDIGYNVVVDKYGQIFEGRHGGLDRPVMGAHAGGFNRNTFGVSMMGTYTSAAPSSAMIESISQIVAWKFRISGINSGWGTTQIVSEAGNVKYARGRTATLPRIFAHRDVGYTTCPGNAGYAKMGTVRARVTALLSSHATASPAVQVSSMTAGGSLTSSDGRHVLRMQGDGNLVLYQGGVAQWASRTYLPGGRLAVQGDGNVVIYDASGRPRWHTASAGRGNVTLMLQSDGNLVLYSGGTPVWDRMARSAGREVRVQTEFASLSAGQTLSALTGTHKVAIGGDGNLVVYTSGNRPVWSTGTRGSDARLRMQGDGNLVLTDGRGRVLWHSGTVGRPGARALIADDGRLSVFHANTRVWAS